MYSSLAIRQCRFAFREALTCDSARRKGEIFRRAYAELLGDIGNIWPSSPRKARARPFNGLTAHLANKPVKNPLIARGCHQDAYGLLPSGVGRQPCWAAFQNLLWFQLRNPPSIYAYHCTSKRGCP